MTIRETVMDVIERHSDVTFLIDAETRREITYGEFHVRACALAGELRGMGLRKGDRVGVMMPNSCELAVLYFGCMYLGAVIVPINRALSKSEVHFILSSCKPALVVADPSCSDAVKAMHSSVVQLSSETSHLEAVEPAARAIETPEAGLFVPFTESTPDDLVLIMYTSGTTAKPKGLAHRIGSMFRNAMAFAKTKRIDRETRFYLTLSMAYMGGFYNLLVLPFLCGASVVVDRVFDARSSLHFWEKARSNGVNALWFAPTVMSILLRMDRGRVGEEFCRSSVRHAFVGFAPLPVKVKHEFEDRYGVRVIENYGLSETLFVTARSSNVRDAGSGYVGEPLPGIQLRIVNSEEESVPPCESGEVQILTPDLMAGYLDNLGNLVGIDSSTWFATGDVGHLDATGSLFITGRKKDLIIRGGVNVSPASIEEVLVQASGVADAAVVSIPHELYGEDVVAVLKLEFGVELESILPALISHAKQNLAQHQQPARYMAIDEFPRTSSGKVQKARIRELVAEKLQIGSRPVVSEQPAEGAAVQG
ncbi:MAG TPA: class I adenylate-forming enzyme family protein [Candidatus Aquilonibacter sp.]|nr:class I adenylate-forming enzyme family protein [Candidatus Aquilonibacter sp.]